MENRYKTSNKVKIIRGGGCILCVILVLTSILLRFPKVDTYNYLNSDATYHTLLTMQAYDETPASVHKFLPIVSLGEEGDKFIPWGATVPDNKGNYYYTSFSSAGFALPYFFVKVFQMPMTEQSLYIFNSLLCGISLLLLIVFFAKNFKDKLDISTIAIFTTLIYLFQNEIMHSQGISFWVHSIFQVLLILQLLVFSDLSKKRNLIIFFILCLVMPYVEWSGYVSNIGFALSLLFRNSKISKKLITVEVKSVLAAVATVALTVVSFGLFCLHFLSVLEKGPFFSALSKRFFARSLNTSSVNLMPLVKSYMQSYGLMLILIFVLICITLFFEKPKKTFFTQLKLFTPLLFVTIFPLLENVIMLQHAIEYSFDRLKAMIPLIFIFSLSFLLGMAFLEGKSSFRY